MTFQQARLAVLQGKKVWCLASDPGQYYWLDDNSIVYKPSPNIKTLDGATEYVWSKDLTTWTPFGGEDCEWAEYTTLENAKKQSNEYYESSHDERAIQFRERQRRIAELTAQGIAI